NKNIVERREVKLGKNNTINYVVNSGLSVHDKLINNSSKIYKQGDKIK
ncbi:efflux RND transporter periplasmic adaptor subunit, partial [Sneathia sp. DSM 16630]|nr:efflux RND transporter periplasmic adaptor subunit [Sneathia sp. DSM 16630]